MTWLTWLFIPVVLGIMVTVTLWAVFAYIAIREERAELPTASLGPRWA